MSSCVNKFKEIKLPDGLLGKSLPSLRLGSWSSPAWGLPEWPAPVLLPAAAGVAVLGWHSWVPAGRGGPLALGRGYRSRGAPDGRCNGPQKLPRHESHALCGGVTHALVLLSLCGKSDHKDMTTPLYRTNSFTSTDTLKQARSSLNCACIKYHLHHFMNFYPHKLILCIFNIW